MAKVGYVRLSNNSALSSVCMSLYLMRTALFVSLSLHDAVSLSCRRTTVDTSLKLV